MGYERKKRTHSDCAMELDLSKYIKIELLLTQLRKVLKRAGFKKQTRN